MVVLQTKYEQTAVLNLNEEASGNGNNGSFADASQVVSPKLGLTQESGLNVEGLSHIRGSLLYNILEQHETASYITFGVAVTLQLSMNEDTHCSYEVYILCQKIFSKYTC